ncbi:hypothetical protein GCM10009610_74020 [Pseudonocardia xinjiangensis]
MSNCVRVRPNDQQEVRRRFDRLPETATAGADCSRTGRRASRGPATAADRRPEAPPAPGLPDPRNPQGPAGGSLATPGPRYRRRNVLLRFVCPYTRYMSD